MKLRRPRPAVLGLVLVVASTLPTSAADAAQTVIVTNVAAAAGLAQTTSTYGAVIHDITGDGVPDVLLNRHWQRPMQLFTGTTGDLYSATATFPAADRHGCDAADVNQDGLMDIYCDQGASNVQGSVVKANNLYIQQADGSFLDEATAMGVDDPYGRGRDLTFIDANGDAYPDLFVGNVGGRTDGLPSHNWMFINDAGTGFHPDGSQAIEAHAGAHCAIPRDITADGWQDLLVCDAGKAGGPLRLFRNDAGAGFSEVTTASGLKGTALDAALVDLNGDTRPDVVSG